MEIEPSVFEKYGRGGLEKDGYARVMDELTKISLMAELPELRTRKGRLLLHKIRRERESKGVFPRSFSERRLPELQIPHTLPDRPDPQIWKPVKPGLKVS